MAFLNPSNQLIQIDTGNALTYLFNKSQSQIPVYASIGEAQVPGQRFFSATNRTAANPSGAPTVYSLVNYLATSAITTGALVGGPAPVYWTDETFTTVTGITSESLGLNFLAGYMMVNTTSLPSLTAALLTGAQLLIATAGLVQAAYGPTAGGGVGNTIVPSAGTFTSAGIAAGTAPTYRTFGVQATVIAAGLCDVLVTGPDII
jgi:hypothetical protein